MKTRITGKKFDSVSERFMDNKLWARMMGLAVVVLFSWPFGAQDTAIRIAPNWDKVVRVSQTTPTLQVVVNPPLRRGTPVHDEAFKALRDLGADYVRYVPWLP